MHVPAARALQYSISAIRLGKSAHAITHNDYRRSVSIIFYCAFVGLYYIILLLLQ